jgi:hypothetical protein
MALNFSWGFFMQHSCAGNNIFLLLLISCQVKVQKLVFLTNGGVLALLLIDYDTPGSTKSVLRILVQNSAVLIVPRMIE